MGNSLFEISDSSYIFLFIGDDDVVLSTTTTPISNLTNFLPHPFYSQASIEYNPPTIKYAIANTFPL